MAPFTVDDGFRLGAVEDPCVSPDGCSALFVVSRPDLEGSISVSTIHLVNLDAADAEPRQVTQGPADGAPRWAPDGRTISFTRGNTIYTMAMDGGEPHQLSPLPLGDALWALNNYEWSPDGSHIALVSRGVAGRTYQPTISMGNPADDMFVADRTFYKWNKGCKTPCTSPLSFPPQLSRDGSWAWTLQILLPPTPSPRAQKEATFPSLSDTGRLFACSDNPGMQRDGEYTSTHIFLVKASGEAQPALQLTSGEQDDHSLSWSPDSTEVCFVSNRTGEWEDNGNNDLFVTDLAGNVRRVTDCPAFCFTPAWVSTQGICSPRPRFKL